MSFDKLTIRTSQVEPRIREFAREHGEPHGRYPDVVDLREFDPALSARLHCGGPFGTHRNKLEFIGVARLGLKEVKRIAASVCGPAAANAALLSRFDVNVDLPGCSVSDLADMCEVRGIQNSAVFRSRSSHSVYAHLGRYKVVLIYDKIGQMRKKRDPELATFSEGTLLTRFELQFRGKGMPIRFFRDLSRLRYLNLMWNVKFRKLHRLKTDLQPMEQLAARGMRCIVERDGLQMASRQFSPSVWKFYRDKFFEPANDYDLPNINQMMRKQIADWLDSKIRFPRLAIQRSHQASASRLLCSAVGDSTI